MTKKLLLWAIALSCALAAALNLLFLSSVIGKTGCSIGAGLIILCYIALVLFKRSGKDTARAEDGPVAKARGIATAVCACLWLLTFGLVLFR